MLNKQVVFFLENIQNLTVHINKNLTRPTLIKIPINQFFVFLFG